MNAHSSKFSQVEGHRVAVADGVRPGSRRHSCAPRRPRSQGDRAVSPTAGDRIRDALAEGGAAPHRLCPTFAGSAWAHGAGTWGQVRSGDRPVSRSTLIAKRCASPLPAGPADRHASSPPAAPPGPPEGPMGLVSALPAAIDTTPPTGSTLGGKPSALDGRGPEHAEWGTASGFLDATSIRGHRPMRRRGSCRRNAAPYSAPEPPIYRHL